MKQKSRRAARMERHHARGKHASRLNLVSLMDIFTILVFFLLVNSSEVEVLPNARDLQMPESIADQKPRETVIVMVTHENILVQGRPIASVADVMRSKSLVIAPLQDALMQQTDRVLTAQAQADIANREVTIMGDKELPYRLLKKVMATCTEAEYGRMSFAVMQKASEQVVENAG